MIDYDRVSDILNEICTSVKPKRNGNGFVCRCPICGDSSKSDRISRLHVDLYPKYQDWIAKCYNGGCPISGSTNLIALHAKAVGNSYIESKKYILDGVYDVLKLKERLRKQKRRPSEQIEKNYTDISIPDECISVEDNICDVIEKRYQEHLKKFIRTRHIPDNHKCFVSHSGKYKGRIIIPVFIGDSLMYFQGRSLFDNIEPKYLNPDIDKTGIILNSDKFDKNKNIIVTEGIIDSWMVEYNQGTPCLGSYFSDELIKKLLKMTTKKVILCFDNPLIDKAGYDELIKFMEQSLYKNKVYYFFPNKKTFKDLNDLKIQSPNINVYDYVVKNAVSLFSVNTKLKLLYKYFM